IPSYAEGVCPRCQQTRKILWRLLDVANPYRSKVWLALGLTMLQTGLMVLPGIFLRYLIDGSLDTHAGRAAMLTGTQRLHNLYFWSGANLLAIVVIFIVIGARLRILTRLGTQIARDLRHSV